MLLGPEAGGLSSTAICRLLTIWQTEYSEWRKRSLEGKDYVYVWADGVYFNVRLEEDRLACLVLIGVLTDGTKEVIANVLDKLPKRLQPRAKMMLHEIMRAPARADAQEEIGRFVQEFEAR